MKNYRFFTITFFLFLIFSSALSAQNIDVQITPPLDTPGACRSNLFTAQIIDPGTHHIQIQAFIT